MHLYSSNRKTQAVTEEIFLIMHILKRAAPLPSLITLCGSPTHGHPMFFTTAPSCVSVGSGSEDETNTLSFRPARYA